MATNLRHGEPPDRSEENSAATGLAGLGSRAVGSWISHTFRRHAERKPQQGSGNRVVNYSTRLGIEAWFLGGSPQTRAVGPPPKRMTGRQLGAVGTVASGQQASQRNRAQRGAFIKQLIHESHRRRTAVLSDSAASRDQ